LNPPRTRPVVIGTYSTAVGRDTSEP
jgi:hypothetical protein